MILDIDPSQKLHEEGASVITIIQMKALRLDKLSLQYIVDDLPLVGLALKPVLLLTQLYKPPEYFGSFFCTHPTLCSRWKTPSNSLRMT